MKTLLQQHQKATEKKLFIFTAHLGLFDEKEKELIVFIKKREAILAKKLIDKIGKCKIQEGATPFNAQDIGWNDGVDYILNELQTKPDRREG